MKKLYVLLLLVMPCIMYGQRFSLSAKNSPLEIIFQKIQEQSNLRFVYTSEDLQLAKPVTIFVKNLSLDSVLAICFHGQPLLFSIHDNFIVIRASEPLSNHSINEFYILTGSVTDENGEPIAGASVRIKSNESITITGTDGRFALKARQKTITVEITSIGYESKEVDLTDGQSQA